jgi:hypothetical protein
MRKLTGIICAALIGAQAYGQAPAAKSATAIASEKDHQNMMDQLHITSLRPGSGPGNPTNYNEAKANPYPNLPDPLTLNNGKKVTSAKEWEKVRRAEIMEDFDREIYGRVPKNVPKVTWKVVSTSKEKNGDYEAIVKKLVGHVDHSSYPQDTVDIQLTLATPADAKTPVPVIMQFGFSFGARPGAARPGATSPVAMGTTAPVAPSWQQQLLAKGWGYAVLTPTSVQPDNGAGLAKGIIGLVNKGQPRKPDDWGALRAWAWGASRALDYFETDKAVNAKEVGIEGHSRYGKATIVTMAYDPRFAIAYVSSSGEGGVKLPRHNIGEILENVAAVDEYHWMAGNFMKYAGPLQWSDLPVDSHELVAMCAPRPVFFSGGAKGDERVDQRGTFMAIVAAGSVYTMLGKKPLSSSEMPPVETGLLDGDLAWRQHSAGHTDAPNWPTFITFASRYLK